MPVYNVAPYLEKCIDSLLRQGDALCDIVLVDDGSSDGSGELCDRAAAAHGHIRVIHKENAGLGFARNTGLDALGEGIDCVLFVDSDDWLCDGFVRALARDMEKSQADCVIAGFTKRDDDGRELFVTRLEPGVFEGEALQRELLPRVCGSAPGASDAIPMSAWATLFSKPLIDSLGLRFPSEREVLSEDLFFKYRFLMHAQRACLSDCVGYCYRTNVKSLTKSYRPDRFEAALRFYEEAKAMAEEGPAAEESIRRLQKSLFIYVRMSISRETLPSSGKTPAEARAAIAEICRDERLRGIIDGFPVGELGFKQRLFLGMVRRGDAGLLFTLAKLGVL